MGCILYLQQVANSRPGPSPKERLERLYHCAHDYMERAGLPGGLPPLQRTTKGKPFFEGTPFHFSISHSGMYWACAFAPSPLGLDIQQVVENKDWQAIARRFFHPDEAAYLEPLTLQDFYRIWCAKEAWVKYTGEGISALKTFSAVRDGQICRSLEGVTLCFPAAPAGYQMALCGAAGGKIQLVTG